LPIGLEIVRLLEVEILNLVGGHERANVECLGGGDTGLLEVLISDDYILALGVLVTLHVAPWHLDVSSVQKRLFGCGRDLLVQQVE
jgi:hypothetical protein